MIQIHIKQSDAEITNTVSGATRNQLMIKLYKDGHLGFAMSGSSFAKAFFMDEDDAYAASSKVGSDTVVRACRVQPSEYTEIIVDGIKCLIEIRALESYIEDNLEVLNNSGVQYRVTVN